MGLYPKGYKSNAVLVMYIRKGIKNILCQMMYFFTNRMHELKYFVSLQLIIYYSFKY